MSTPFAGPTATSLRLAPRWCAITVSTKARLTFPIGYLGRIASVMVPSPKREDGPPWLASGVQPWMRGRRKEGCGGERDEVAQVHAAEGGRNGPNEARGSVHEGDCEDHRCDV